jgi:hypothetical protein
MIVVVALSGGWAFASDDQETPISFNRSVRPILARCLPCHGPDAGARAADLRLDIREGATRSRRRGAAIVPGDPASSLLLERVQTNDHDRVMPPAGKGAPLDDQEIELLRRWIESGAEYETHWAWQHPSSSPPPPEVDSDWPRRDLDRYVAARHLELNLRPSPEADRAVLARRVSLDLLGIPPTLQSVDAFVRDQREDAFERFVDDLLDSPAFGERWARVWLDVARYADTRGYEADRPRTIWPWRDWVIRAFNADLPFDRFTLEQIAGDLIPDANDDSILATAFHRNTMNNDEGGTRDEEFRMAAVIDRVNTTMSTWMGLTAECAACHDHKYDPIEQREYYQLAAFFNTTMDADRPDEFPLLAHLGAEDRLRRADLTAQRQAIQTRDEVQVVISPPLELQDSRLPESLDPDGSSSLGGVPILGDVLPPGASLFDEVIDGRLPWDDSIVPPPGALRARRSVAPANAIVQHHFNGVAPSAQVKIAEGDLITVWVLLDADNPPDEIMIQVHSVQKTWGHRAYWGANQIQLGTDGTPDRRRLGDLPKTGEWQRLEIEPAAIGLDPGAMISGLACTQHGDLDGGLTSWGPVVVERSSAAVPSWQTDFEVWLAAMASVDGRGLPASLQDSLRAGDQRSVEARANLEAHWRLNATLAGIALRRSKAIELDPIDKEIAAIEARERNVPVLREQAEADRRVTNILTKGDWRSPAEEVLPGTPAFLHPIAVEADARPSRLELAKWLTDPQNPLTARVHVNRVWERFFGRGLVETAEDFGTQGMPPDDQAMLDHLAVQFMDSGWSHKMLCREIVTSSTYRQSSVVSSQALQTDPLNRNLARGARFRLEAEAIRDSALEASGLRSHRMFGPPVFPPQPDGVWEIVYSGDRWNTAMDDDRYRRAIYTFWRRTAPYPSMIAFDAGSRETCAVRRLRTNTPLQALVTLNDIAFIETAGGLARRAHAEAPDSQRLELERAFRLAVIRSPEEAEIEILEQLLEAQTLRFRDSPEQAAALILASGVERPEELEPADFAARIVVANVLLNLDEFLNRG